MKSLDKTDKNLFVSWIYRYQRKRKELLLKINNIPDALQHCPIIGAGHLFVGKSPEDLFVMSTQLLKASPLTIGKFFLFNKLTIVCREPRYVQKILSSPYCLDKATPYLILPAQNGLIASKAALWKPRRKMLNSTFHITLLQTIFMQHFNEVAQSLVTDLQYKVEMNAFDISPFISFRTTELQLKSMYNGVIADEKILSIADYSTKTLEMIGDVALNFYKYSASFLIGKLFNVEQPDERISNNLLKNFETLIELAKKQYFDKTTELSVIDKEKPELLIHKLVTLVEQGNFIDRDMKDHLTTMTLAGSGTLSVSISNCLLCLAMNKDAQEKCAVEIKEMINGQFGNITTNDLIKLELLDRTINECMRLFTIVPYIARKCVVDLQLDDDKIIPAGTDIIIPIIGIHHSKEYWGANPTTFNPDNFLPKNVAKRPLLSFMPYSYGIRNCIAKKYAQYALKVFMVYLLVNYKFSTDLTFDELKFTYSLTSVLKNKCMIRIEKR